MLAVVPHCLVGPALGMGRAVRCSLYRTGRRPTDTRWLWPRQTSDGRVATVRMRVARGRPASIDARAVDGCIATYARRGCGSSRAGMSMCDAAPYAKRLTHTLRPVCSRRPFDALFLAAGAAAALALRIRFSVFPLAPTFMPGSHIRLNWDAGQLNVGQHVSDWSPGGITSGAKRLPARPVEVRKVLNRFSGILGRHRVAPAYVDQQQSGVDGCVKMRGRRSFAQQLRL